MPLSGSEEFIEFLLGHDFPSPEDGYEIMEGSDVSGHALECTGFNKPVLIPRKDGLRIKVPPNILPTELLNYIDSSTVVDVIDVRAQCEVQMTLQAVVDHFYSSPRTKLLNMLSLEFSSTDFSKFVEPPHVVSELSLVSTCWIPETTEDDHESVATIPSVQKYCLLSMAGSYTDFHIDFGGSSVWYHVMWGEKIFYLIPPTTENFSSYWSWSNSPQHRTTFFPDLLRPKITNADGTESPQVFQLRLHPGQTVLLPAGWIHAVYTVSDCLVFGGNFLNELHIPTQLAVYKMEQLSGTLQKFQFPNFEKVHWFTADRLVGKLTNALHARRTPPSYQLDAAHSLIKFLPRWLRACQNMPPEDRAYYLPSPGILELPYAQLIERLIDLVAAFSPSKHLSIASPRLCSSRTKPDSRSAATRSKPGTSGFSGKPTESKLRKKSRKSAARHTADEPVDLGGEKLRRRSKHHAIDSKGLATDDADILEALPELSDSRLIGDHYYMVLSDSEEEEVGRSVSKRVGSQKVSAHRKHDADPTWTACDPVRRKTSSSLSSPFKKQLVRPGPVKYGLHPLLHDVGRLQPSSSSDTPRPSTSTAARKKSTTTVRQRLAKRLGF